MGQRTLELTQTMKNLFFYGTLRDAALLSCVLGRAGASVKPAVLSEHAVLRVAGESYPTIVQRPGAQCEGLLLLGPTDDDIARLDFYEGGHAYALQLHQVLCEGQLTEASVYIPDQPGDPQQPLWDLAHWQTHDGALARLAARDVMAHYGKVDASFIARRFPMIRARAAARLNAQDTAPTTLRRRATAGDVQIQSQSEVYANFFSVEEYDLTHRRFDGSISAPLNRGAFISADAATVLPYDPQRDCVMLIEQFRMGPFARGDMQCWSLEAIAGRIDAGETPEACVHREAAEEAGITLSDLHAAYRFYPSPGGQVEYIYSFIGIADLPDTAAGLGGVPSEGEDIRAHIVPFERLMALLESGELENGPLIVSVQWLALHRARLRSKS